ncbi:MAG: hypothetical protein ACYDAR_18130 [Thermomicrobiales bacterium]
MGSNAESWRVVFTVLPVMPPMLGHEEQWNRKSGYAKFPVLCP